MLYFGKQNNFCCNSIFTNAYFIYKIKCVCLVIDFNVIYHTVSVKIMIKLLRQLEIPVIVVIYLFMFTLLKLSNFYNF